MKIKQVWAVVLMSLLMSVGSNLSMVMASGFSDVLPDSPYYEAINSLQTNGIIQGYADGTYKPDQTVNRVEALKIILLGAKIIVPEIPTVQLTFSDINNGDWYIKYLAKAVELGIVQGYSDNTFKPNQTVNLVENLKILINTKGIDLSGIQVTANPYVDANYTDWYAKFVQYAKDQNWISADDKNMIYPSQEMTRGKLAQLIFNSQKSDQLSSVKFEGKYIDAHVHLAPNNFSLEDVVKNMDTEGIDMMVVMEVPSAIYYGVPQAESGIPDAAKKYPDRFVVLYGGEAITKLDEVVKNGSYTEAETMAFTKQLEDAMKTGKYSGFGEIALKHLALKGEQGADIEIPGDHPWMLIMSDIAAKYNVPIDIHMDIKSGELGIAGLEKLLEHNRNTKIIWSHLSWSRNNYDSAVSVETMRALLNKHPNLYSSLKIQPAETAFLDADKQIVPEWLALFEEYPDRFMIGSDIKPGQFEDEFKFIKRHIKFLEQLPVSILKQIERENVKRLYNIK